MKGNRKTKQALLISGITTVILLCANVFLFMYLNTTKKEFDELRSVLSEKNTKIGNQFALKASIMETEVDREKIHSYFVTGEDEAATLLERLEGVSSELSIPITIDLQTGKRVFKEGEKGRDVLSISVEGEGTFQKLSQLLFLVENLPYKNSIAQIVLERKSGTIKNKAPEWTLALKFDIVSYLQKTP
jgi:hypothetical protein